MVGTYTSVSAFWAKEKAFTWAFVFVVLVSMSEEGGFSIPGTDEQRRKRKASRTSLYTPLRTSNDHLNTFTSPKKT
jgi:hypothetical protein